MLKKCFLILSLIILVFIVSCKKNPTSHKNVAPVAAFTFSPSSGTTVTVFNFDASSSTDQEDPISDLQVRWDWENDGTWDTEYRTIKTITKIFSEARTYNVVLEVVDTEGLIDTIIDTIDVITANNAPTASFTVNPSSGTTATIFTFDASGSTDVEDATADLQARWDWENDGTWDTEYSTTKTATKNYAIEGEYSVKLEIMDSEGDTNSIVKTINVSANTAPNALFNIQPVTGTINTVFAFDAGGSTDNEDLSADLQVRWDWENDGVYDTNYSTTKTASHQYSSTGTYTIKLEVMDTEGLTDTDTRAIIVDNTAPSASFTVDPSTGSVNTTFNFDASASSDNEDATESLMVRWDWENDGVYDTNYSATKTASHQYGAEGTYTIVLQVKDTEDWTNTTTKTITVQDQGTVVSFSDASFEALIRTTISKPSGDITDIDLETITTLNGGGWNISNISGIEYCTYLTYLTLWGNQIIDLSDLSDLTNLEWIDLSNNQIIDINPLVQNSGLGNGDTIYLTGNPLNSTSINTYITTLEARGVTVNYNNGTVVTFADAAFEALIRSKLGKPTGDITDIDMETITALVGEGWAITDITGIEYCTNLVTLNLANNSIVSIALLEDLINLDWVDLSNNLIVNIGGVLGNLGLSTGDILYLVGNPLSSTSESYIPDIEARGVTVYY